MGLSLTENKFLETILATSAGQSWTIFGLSWGHLGPLLGPS